MTDYQNTVTPDGVPVPQPGRVITGPHPRHRFPAHLFEYVNAAVPARCAYCGMDLEESDGVSPCPKSPR